MGGAEVADEVILISETVADALALLDLWMNATSSDQETVLPTNDGGAYPQGQKGKSGGQNDAKKIVGPKGTIESVTPIVFGKIS